MKIGDLCIRRKPFRHIWNNRVYEVVSEPIKMWGVPHYEVRFDNKLYLISATNLKKIVL